MVLRFAFSAFWLLGLFASLPAVAEQGQTPTSQPVAAGPHDLRFEETRLTDGGVPINIQTAWRAVPLKRRPAILMLGALHHDELPEWSTGLVGEGYMLVAFTADYPPDPDPARRPQWLVFDQRFAHSYVIGGYRAARDAKRVVEYLRGRGAGEPMEPREFVCPASDEGGKRVTCDGCGACNGTRLDERVHAVRPVIIAHGPRARRFQTVA